MNTYEEWKEFANKPGAISTVKYISWLLEGCPKYGGKEWQITNDGWCYCYDCGKGYSTDSIWTNRPLEHFNKNGYHCFMCKGFGKINGEDCDECDGEITNKESK